MADVKTREEGSALPEKRKSDEANSLSKTLEENKEKEDNKKPKLEIPSDENQKNGKLENISAAVEEEDDEDDNEEDYEAAKEHSNGETEIVDRKGKGIMADEKGKGKMIDDDSDDEDEDDDDDSSDDSDSDFSDGLDDSDVDDPLAEVDLDNILPSRTRRRGAQPGLRISSDGDKGPDA